MYGKVIDGALSPAPRVLHHDGLITVNPKPPLLISQGYKPVTYTDKPDDGAYYTAAWTETENACVQSWVEGTPPEPVVTPEQQRDNDIDAALVELADIVAAHDDALVELAEIAAGEGV